MSTLTPIASGLWTDEAEPRLIGGRRKSDGQIVFPMPGGDAAADHDPVALSRTGALWSWTIQGFAPKRPPYDGPEPFEPFALGYVELDGVIVETRLVGQGPFRIGQTVELVIAPFDENRATFAFKPVEPA